MDSTNSTSNSKFKIIEEDPMLLPYQGFFEKLDKRDKEVLHQINSSFPSGIDEFSRGYEHYGLFEDDNSYYIKEWLPGAKQVYLMGDFNFWNREELPLTKNGYGVFSRVLSKQEVTIQPGSFVKLHIVTDKSPEGFDRNMAYCRYTIQDPKSFAFSQEYVPVKKTEPFKHIPKKVPSNQVSKKEDLVIYECHVGMSSNEPKISTYKEFTENMLPYIKEQGYNAIQLMAIQEHAYYASFGYQVTNFFAPSSRFGSIKDFKALVKRAHELDIKVIIDIVLSHASSNAMDGIGDMDGTDHQYFHGGEKGNHDVWGSKLFDYGKFEVLRFLCSNIRFWIEEFDVDGFRLDAVTSILYTHHGIGVGFTGKYDEYFGNDNLDLDACVFMKLIRRTCDISSKALDSEGNSQIILIAEDVSGIPGLCRPIEYGGLGCDYRLAMNIPDYWRKQLKDGDKDHFIDKSQLLSQMLNRRKLERVISYVECHDQVLQGDKTFIMHLLNARIYDSMKRDTLGSEDPKIRARLNLSKTMKMLTLILGGSGYLNFMGNEFSHPEWVEFPEKRNGNSFDKCRRLWHLIKEENNLIYRELLMFDKTLINFVKEKIPLDSAIFVHHGKEEKWDLLDFTKDHTYRVFVNLTSQTITHTVEEKLKSFETAFNSVDERFGPTIFDQGQRVEQIDHQTIKVVLHAYSFYIIKITR